ncbi:APC family permease [Ktedonosporobacter rubrisoli]|uniref:APC family permease n=1 Tax=Ktedonosporobacter rubrisoli TaxID=2509675 RepID=A0A4P6JHT4_KTERU|nr:APC family permease [Ktedonosporobacter rubrisoli]QBD74594.1 APC family permease [Ktedonosporobacter rubrisoli]
MEQQAISQGSLPNPPVAEHGKSSLGPVLCWAVVFADIGSSIYYTPGILYSSVGGLAGFFVLLTMVVFILLTLKYAEVSARFPEGGGVVSVAAQGIHTWAGAVGGMFILVSYFLTAAISCLSSLQYLAVVFPAILPHVLWITIGVLILLGLLNWVGVSESAKVSMIAAIISFGSDLLVLWTVFTNISPSELITLFTDVFRTQALTPSSILVGFAGAFLAFSGLESISQLSPVMKAPRKKVISLALLLVVLTIGFTSPLLTTLSTLLQPEAAHHEVLSTQLVSLLGGHWGNTLLQTEVAISASLILAFASNTAIIGAYHVFLALSRMDFLPPFILKRNSFRGTPHYSIALSVGIPILVLLIVNGQINLLGDLYAFGLLGAFSLTCLGLDMIRFRELKKGTHTVASLASSPPSEKSIGPAHTHLQPVSGSLNGHQSANGTVTASSATLDASQLQRALRTATWKRIDFVIGVLTTVLVMLAWFVGLFSKPLGAAFGGSVVLIGVLIAVVNSMHRGRTLVLPARLQGRVPDSTLVVLLDGEKLNEQIINSALHAIEQQPVVFLYLSKHMIERNPRPFEILDPYLEDSSARETLSKAEQIARKQKVTRRFVYLPYTSAQIAQVWRFVQPRDVVIPAELLTRAEDINPDRIRYELTPHGKIAHLLKRW